MAFTPSLTYKGRPLVRCGNDIYYGSMHDPYVVYLQVLTTKKEGNAPKQTIDFEEMAANSGSLDLDENFYGDQDFDLEDFDQEGFDIGGGEGGTPFEEEKF